MTPDQFAQTMRTASVKVTPNTERVVKELAIQALVGVVFATPVLFGRARGNWQVGLAVTKRERLDRLDKGGQQTAVAGIAEIQGFSLEAHGFIVLSNNMPYILRLNSGPPFTKKAPAMFIESAVDAAVRQIEGASVLS